MPVEISLLPLAVNKKTKRQFLKWLYDSGWEPYDSTERWINLKQGNKLLTILQLFQTFRTEHKCS